MMFHDQEFLDTLSSRKDCVVKSVDAGETYFRFLVSLAFSDRCPLELLGHWLMISKAEEVTQCLTQWLDHHN
jgi:hypothetical protein